MKIILERLASPYLSRRTVKFVYDNVIPEKTLIYDLKYLTLIGAGIMSVRDTTSWKAIYTVDGETVVVETHRYRVYFRNKKCLSLSDEELASNWVYNFLRNFIGPVAALGAVAILHGDVVDVEKIESKNEQEVSSEVA